MEWNSSIFHGQIPFFHSKTTAIFFKICTRKNRHRIRWLILPDLVSLDFSHKHSPELRPFCDGYPSWLTIIPVRSHGVKSSYFNHRPRNSGPPKEPLSKPGEDPERVPRGWQDSPSLEQGHVERMQDYPFLSSGHKNDQGWYGPYEIISPKPWMWILNSCSFYNVPPPVMLVGLDSPQ